MPCRLPSRCIHTPGLKVLSRKSFEASATSEFDNPLATYFDENDALMYFDDVKAPWERVFVYRNTDMCRAQFHDTAGHMYQNYQAQLRLLVNLKCLLGTVLMITETAGPRNLPHVDQELGQLAAQAASWPNS